MLAASTMVTECLWSLCPVYIRGSDDGLAEMRKWVVETSFVEDAFD